MNQNKKDITGRDIRLVGFDYVFFKTSLLQIILKGGEQKPANPLLTNTRLQKQVKLNPNQPTSSSWPSARNKKASQTKENTYNSNVIFQTFIIWKPNSNKDPKLKTPLVDPSKISVNEVTNNVEMVDTSLQEHFQM